MPANDNAPIDFRRPALWYVREALTLAVLILAFGTVIAVLPDLTQ